MEKLEDLNTSIELLGFQNMKVADLKRELKARGLSSTGNKNELIERLQGSLGTPKDVSAESELGNFDNLEGGDDVSVDEEDLNEEDHLSPFPNAELSSLEPDKDDFNESDILESAVKHEPTEINEPVIVAKKRKALNVSEKKPLKKKTTAKTNEVKAKKLSLKLSKKTFPSLSALAVQSAAVVAPVPIAPSSPPTEEKADAPKKVAVSVKNMTSEERMAMRAKRFNVASNKGKLQVGTDRIGTRPQTANRSRELTLGKSNNPLDVEVLKKRAERFGQNVSAVMKQIEEKEKVLKRKLRFGASASISAASASDEDERRKRRAERFGFV